MRYFRLILSEKRGKYHFDKAYEKFIQAENRDLAYNKALKIITLIGDPDKDMIFWVKGNYIATWINGLEEIEII